MVIQNYNLYCRVAHRTKKKCLGEGDIIYGFTEEAMLELKKKQQIITKTLNMENNTF